MAADGGVAAALASAKKTLKGVAHSNIDTGGQHAWTPAKKPAAAPVKSDLSNVPYSAARKSGLAGEAQDAGEGIKHRMETEDAARKSLEQ